MNKPEILCDRCAEMFHCYLNYDGRACRKIRDVEPSNADLFRSMSDEEMVEYMWIRGCPTVKMIDECIMTGMEEKSCKECWLNWLKRKAG